MNLLKTKMNCICKEYLAGIFPVLGSCARRALEMLFGGIVAGKSTLVTDLAQPLRRDSSAAEAKRAIERISGWLGRWDFVSDLKPWLLGKAREEASDGRSWTAEDRGMDAAEHIVAVKREGWKAVIRVKDMDRDVFGDGLPIDRSHAQVPFVPATLRKHGGTRNIQLRWRPGVVTWCDKPYSKDAKAETARVLVVESRFDGKSIWLYAVCPDAMLDDPGGQERIARRAAQAYHDRWQIETSFQTVKQEFGLEKARVRTFKRLENLFSLCILAYVFATDHLRRTPGFRKVLKLLSDNLEKVSTKTHALLAGIRALVGMPTVRFISGRPRKAHPPDPLQLLLAL